MIKNFKGHHIEFSIMEKQDSNGNTYTMSAFSLELNYQRVETLEPCFTKEPHLFGFGSLCDMVKWHYEKFMQKVMGEIKSLVHNKRMESDLCPPAALIGQ